MDRSENSTKLHSILFIYHINIQNVSSSRLAVKCKRTLNQLVTTTTTRRRLRSEMRTDEFGVGCSVSEVDSRDVEHVAHVVVRVARLVGVDVVAFPLLPRQLQRNRLDRHDLACAGRPHRAPYTRYTRSTQPCIPPGSLNRVPASAGVRAGMSPLPGGR